MEPPTTPTPTTPLQQPPPVATKETNPNSETINNLGGVRTLNFADADASKPGGRKRRRKSKRKSKRKRKIKSKRKRRKSKKKYRKKRTKTKNLRGGDITEDELTQGKLIDALKTNALKTNVAMRDMLNKKFGKKELKEVEEHLDKMEPEKFQLLLTKCKTVTLGEIIDVMTNIKGGMKGGDLTEQELLFMSIVEKTSAVVIIFLLAYLFKD